jgi:putative two-component system protein, hydrogenase maturation factor HypX/HoxX
VFSVARKRAIPEDIWRDRPCLIVHPGIVGDRGPSALDWAVLENEKEWGVTVVEPPSYSLRGGRWCVGQFILLYRT